MARMKAKMDDIERKIDGNKEEMMVARAETTLMMVKMDAAIRSSQKETIKALTEALGEEAEACEGAKHASLEEEEPAPEETEAVAESKKVSEGATDEETIGAAKNRSRDLRLAIGCRGQLETGTKRDGGLR
jgi:hypothetical protein